MKLSELLKNIQYTRVIMPKDEVEVLGVNIDSRLVKDGDMFIAVRGTQTDGHAYISGPVAGGQAPAGSGKPDHGAEKTGRAHRRGTGRPVCLCRVLCVPEW